MAEYTAIHQQAEPPNWSSEHRLYLLTKRITDLIITGLGLFLLSPVLVLIAIAIRLDSPGPVFYRRKAIGRHGKPFDMFKFRTMHIPSSADVAAPTTAGIYKVDYDPRVSRLGRFLRKFSLDELPQLLNVMMGNMSLVGPRAAFAFELNMQDETTRIRLEVLPGLTGLWQISGRSDYQDMANMDLYYVTHASLLLDLRLLFETIPAVLRGGGAY